MKKSAFPHSYKGQQGCDCHITYIDHGMTLREYYAGQALQGILASGCPGSCTISSSKDAVRLADALIAELEENHEYPVEN